MSSHAALSAVFSQNVAELTHMVSMADDRRELLNLNCKLVNFIQHLKEKCGLGFEGELLWETKIRQH